VEKEAADVARQVAMRGDRVIADSIMILLWS
jgi:hypothetical protein